MRRHAAIARGHVAAPALLAVHLGGEVEEELVAEVAGSPGALVDEGVEVAAHDGVEVDRAVAGVGLPVDERDASLGEVAGHVGGPVLVPAEVAQLYRRLAADARVGRGHRAVSVEVPEERAVRGHEDVVRGHAAVIRAEVGVGGLAVGAGGAAVGDRRRAAAAARRHEGEPERARQEARASHGTLAVNT
jgi:hypothetical protein